MISTALLLISKVSRRYIFVLALALSMYGVSIPSAFAELSPDFESEIAPLLIRRCVECHQGNRPAGGLQLTSREGMHLGGDSGVVIDLEDVEASLLLQRIVDGDMPPEQQGKPQHLPDDEIELIRKWIESGARWPENRELDYFERTNEVRAGRDWWSLQPIERPRIPKLQHHVQPSNPIDAFVLAKLETYGIEPAPPADRRTLIRRVYYDLIGLPPSESEIEEFVRDTSPDAWANLIDDLLAKPQYGERWGRYWLDLARYADTSGYERDQEKPFAWKYRDWVVSAFNHDMPYDQFIIEQLAGDEIDDPSDQSLIATGFLRLGPWNDEPNDPADYQYERLEDLVHTTSSAFLALTVKCARCHSHKFDAITQEDYYRMASAFWGGPIAPDRSRDALGGPTAEELGSADILAWTDVREPPPLHVLKNGERDHPLELVVPASLSTIPDLEREFESPVNDGRSSRRRLQLAQWIAHPKNPLTPRVMVNRIWQHHFGQAIVRTPNNFGFLADEPTHPDLLDWLAAEFVSRGWRIKEMHRLILTSKTWQQASLHPSSEELELLDSGNRLWWKAERRQLDAEALRDSLLAASQEIELTVGGEGFRPTINPEALEGLSRKAAAWQASEESKQKRRSLYIFFKRGLLPPLMTTFDLCDPTQSCGQRDVTIVPTQALALLNNRFVHDRSERLATRIADNHDDLESQIRSAWSLVLKRQPTNDELNIATQHVTTQRRNFSSLDRSEPIASDVTLRDSLKDDLVFHLRADRAVVDGEEDKRLSFIADSSDFGHDMSQEDENSRPLLEREGIGGKPTLRFDGNGRFLNIKGQLLERAECTVICVVRDDGGAGHREVISNWDGSAGNSTSSIFVGLTNDTDVRFSDAFSPAGKIVDRSKPFILTAVNGSEEASVLQNGRQLAKRAALPSRRLDTSWVIGQQGNIGGEYWKGGIAEIRIYKRALLDAERDAIEQELSEFYGIELSEQAVEEVLTPDVLALASLCHVLMNSNEFLYID